MSEIVTRLRDRRLNVWEQAKEIADRAAEENRNFTAEEQGKWDALNEELSQLDTRIKSALETEARAKETEDAFNALERRPRTQPQGSQRGSGGGQGEDTEDELRAFLRGERGRTYDATPGGRLIRPEQRDLTKGAATAGGNTVPTSFYDRLVEHLIETASLMGGGVTILNTAGGETIQIPKTTAHGTAAIVASEGTLLTENDPTFGQVPLGAFKYGTIIEISRELLDDTGVDLEGYLARMAGRALGNAFGNHLVVGTGSSQPRGITIDTTLGVTGGTGVSGAFTADNLIDLHYSVIAPYRASSACMWAMRDASVAGVRKLKDAQGQYLFQPSLVAGTPDTLLGKPILTEPNMAAVGLNNKSVLFGDLSQYFVRLAGGIRFERSDDYKFGNDLVAFRALLRGDGALVDLTGAVKHFVGAAS